MLGVIKGNAGDAGSGKWDVAAIPGGGGNWGGSFLAVPRQSRHQAEAAALALWLTSPDSHITAFKTAGGLPSDTVALADDELLNFTNAYFNNAPVGRIFGDGAKKLQPVFLGIRHQDVREQAVEPALKAVEAGELSAAAGWRRAVAEAKKKAI
jgi:cellobiose transport system substrate-binding protein